MSSAGAPEAEWDIFISFAAPDQARAEELADALVADDWRVFVSSRAIEPGEDWSKILAEALEHSRLVAVLLSESSDAAHYQREEIHRAIALARQNRVLLIPIYLDGAPEEAAAWEFGLRSYQRIDFKRRGLERTASALSRKLDASTCSDSGSAETAQVHDHPDTEQHGSPAAPELERRMATATVGEVLHGAALRIDRTRQWEPLVRICRSEESALFLLHGPRQQNLDLFVLRVFHYLAGECDHHQMPFVVPLRLEWARPRSWEAWENHLRVGVGGEGSQGTAEDLLIESARHNPVFLILSRLPIGTDSLDGVERAALEDFLRRRLPELIAHASEGRHPIRALVASHYENEESSMVAALDRSASRGCAEFGVRYRKLHPLQAVGWGDIEDFLNDFEHRPPPAVFQQLHAAFDSLDHGSLEFRELVELLSRELE